MVENNPDQIYLYWERATATNNLKKEITQYTLFQNDQIFHIEISDILTERNETDGIIVKINDEWEHKIEGKTKSDLV